MNAEFGLTLAAGVVLGAAAWWQRFSPWWMLLAASIATAVVGVALSQTPSGCRENSADALFGIAFYAAMALSAAGGVTALLTSRFAALFCAIALGIGNIVLLISAIAPCLT
jgi:hypothetical protein